jgi:D-alanyl-D-alanine carboxypeptidase (penicillin-binding protein 5/6)
MKNTRQEPRVKNHAAQNGPEKERVRKRAGDGEQETFLRKTVLPSFRLIVLFSIFIFSFSLLTAASAEEIKSRAAVVMDALTGRVLYAKNPDLRLLPASTTKLMTALVVLERANLSDVVTVSKKAAGTPPTRVGLKEGDKVTIENLLYAALMRSANDAAVALAEAVAGSEEEFVRLMNMKALAIGANDTRYINANGLPGEGQYITAYDLSIIMRQAIKYPVLKEILGTRITDVTTETGKQIVIKNTNRLLWSDDDLLGGKTGYTRKARHCFVCAGERANDTIIVALLGAPLRSLLWKETEELLSFGAKVLNKTEEPVLYMTQTDRALETTKVSYTPGSSHATGKAKVKKHGRKRRHTAVHKASVKGRKPVIKTKGKNRKSKEQNIAQQREDGSKG